MTAVAKQPVDQATQRLEARIDSWILRRDVWRGQIEPQIAESLVDTGDLAGEFVDDGLQPRANNCDRSALSRFALSVVAGVLPNHAFGSVHVGLGRAGTLCQALIASAPRICEGRWATEQALSKDLHSEGAGHSPAVLSAADQYAHPSPECTEGITERDFPRCQRERLRLRRQPGTELRRRRALVDLPLQPTQHHFRNASLLGRLQFIRLGEANGVQRFEQPGEATRVAVVGSRTQEQPVLEVRCHEAERATEVAVLAEGRRHQVVALVNDQQIPRQVRRVRRCSARGDELLEDVVLPQVVVRRDDAAEGTPRIRVHAEAFAKRVRLRAVDQIEVQRELGPHLLLPLRPERGRRQNQHALDAPAQQQLGENQAGFHRLAEADIVGDQQIDARHAQRLQQRDELEVFNLYGAVEGTGDRKTFERAVTVWIEVWRRRGPA